VILVYRAIRPQALLEGIVEAFWRIDATGGPHRVVPDGCMDFIFDLDDPRGALVVGAMQHAKVVHLRAGARVFGVRFRPGAAALYIDAPARELRDRVCPLYDVTRSRRSQLVDRVLASRTDDDRRSAVGAFLDSTAARVRASDARLRRAVHVIEASKGMVPVADVASHLAIGERQLQRLFDERIGVGPKLFARVARLRHARELQGRTDERDATLALNAGYADQAHYVRECRALFGVTPTIMARERGVGFVQSTRARTR